MLGNNDIYYIIYHIYGWYNNSDIYVYNDEKLNFHVKSNSMI